MDNVYCPYCSGNMIFIKERSDDHRDTFTYYKCEHCSAQSPRAKNAPMGATRMLAQTHIAPKPEVYTEEQLFEDGIIPTVIWVEFREDEPIAGVNQLGIYQLEDEREFCLLDGKASYNITWRVWDDYPQPEEREGVMWKDEALT